MIFYNKTLVKVAGSCGSDRFRRLVCFYNNPDRSCRRRTLGRYSPWSATCRGWSCRRRTLGRYLPWSATCRGWSCSVAAPKGLLPLEDSALELPAGLLPCTRQEGSGPPGLPRSHLLAGSALRAFYSSTIFSHFHSPCALSNAAIQPLKLFSEITSVCPA